MNSDRETTSQARALGAAVLALRRGAELTQEEVAARAGTNAPALSRIESGERDPRWSTLVRILTAIGASHAQLAEKVAAYEARSCPPPG